MNLYRKHLIVQKPHQVILKGVEIFCRISNSGKLYYLNANFKAYSDIK
jgi:hypothetical protein